MALQDAYGNRLGTASPEARDQLDLGVARFLAADHGASDAFRSATEADPGFGLAHAGLARALMMEGRMGEARQAIARAEELTDESDTRARSHVGVLALVLAGKPVEARAAVRAHVADHPRDALVAQLCTNVFGLIGFSGEVGREAELLAYTEALLPHYGEDWWMMSMHALSLCETGQVAASQALMERSLALNPRNANGAHFKAHAHYEAGETAAGRAYLTAWMEDYDARALLHGHLSWHQALWALHQGDEAEMWALVDARIAPGASQSLSINILTDTVAILYRAALAGIEIAPERWAALSDYAARFFPNTGQSFADMHAALAHAMAGQGERLAGIAQSATGFAGDLVRPVARAWQAIARQDWNGALDDLVRVLPATERLGGSRAQRDLIELAYVNVLMRLGLADEARRTLAARRPMLSGAPAVVGMA